MPLTLYGTESHKIELTMKNVFMSMREGAPISELIRACHYDRITLEDICIKSFDGSCLIKSKSVGEIDIRNVDCALPTNSYVEQTDEAFIIKRI